MKKISWGSSGRGLDSILIVSCKSINSFSTKSYKSQERQLRLKYHNYMVLPGRGNWAHRGTLQSVFTGVGAPFFCFSALPLTVRVKWLNSGFLRPTLEGAHSIQMYTVPQNLYKSTGGQFPLWYLQADSISSSGLVHRDVTQDTSLWRRHHCGLLWRADDWRWREIYYKHFSSY